MVLRILELVTILLLFLSLPFLLRVLMTINYAEDYVRSVFKEDESTKVYDFIVGEL